MPPITNCHVHLFVFEDVPKKFLSPLLSTPLRWGPLRRGVVRFLDRFWPFSSGDQLSRYADFIEHSYDTSQANLFKRIRGQHPQGTRFVVLPMDMTEMNAGPLRRPYEAQLEALADLREKQPDLVLPFIAIDPRRRNLLNLIETYLNRGFVGLKLYPPLGYWPSDPRLDEVYALAVERDLPLLTHASRGGVYHRGIPNHLLTEPGTGVTYPKAHPRDFTDHLSRPNAFRSVLEKYPALRLCFAHFGGGAEWEKYLHQSWHPEDQPGPEPNWVHQTRQLIDDDRYPNLFTDVSYTLTDQRFLPLLRLMLANNPHLARHTLFGTDFYMAIKEDSERSIAIKFHHEMGPELFNLLARDNPARFLNQ